jgi:hypothetical protein
LKNSVNETQVVAPFRGLRIALRSYGAVVALGLALATFFIVSGMVRQQAADASAQASKLAVKFDTLQDALKPVAQLAVRLDADERQIAWLRDRISQSETQTDAKLTAMDGKLDEVRILAGAIALKLNIPSLKGTVPWRKGAP